MNNWIGPTIKNVWNVASHNFFGGGVVMNTKAYHLGQCRLHFPLFKSAMLKCFVALPMASMLRLCHNFTTAVLVFNYNNKQMLDAFVQKIFMFCSFSENAISNESTVLGILLLLHCVLLLAQDLHRNRFIRSMVKTFAFMVPG